ncbi:unnamed protein product [Rhizophagus irregularis]|nr:unnamed protein product [Rhizophagus irregularis]
MLANFYGSPNLGIINQSCRCIEMVDQLRHLYQERSIREKGTVLKNLSRKIEPTDMSAFNEVNKAYSSRLPDISQEKNKKADPTKEVKKVDDANEWGVKPEQSLWDKIVISRVRTSR